MWNGKKFVTLYPRRPPSDLKGDRFRIIASSNRGVCRVSRLARVGLDQTCCAAAFWLEAEAQSPLRSAEFAR